MDLLGGGVIIRFQGSFQDETPLHGAGNAQFRANAFQLFEAFLPGQIIHDEYLVANCLRWIHSHN